MPRRTLAEWLSYQEELHPKLIDLGLERLTSVLERLGWRGFACPVITVGGTNGKGSCVALLESIISAQQYRVGSFTSPHLIRYNERIRIAGRDVHDGELIDAFERIEAARGDISITFFEFNTLAALLIFERASLDAVVLEVGLGGKLDAVNVVDADAAIVSSIALDHCEWLGNDLESIARWKAGIFRSGRPAIFGARQMPSAIKEEASRIGATLLRLGVDFDFAVQDGKWAWRGREELRDLPLPALPGTAQLDNAAAVLSALDCLRTRLPISRSAIEVGLNNVELPGRFQLFEPGEVGAPAWLLDVAHNPAAAETLAQNLRNHSCEGKTIAVCGMFADKDIDGVITAVADEIDVWIPATVAGRRASAAAELARKITAHDGIVVRTETDVAAACNYARSIASPADRIVVFGSFYAVGPALEWLDSRAPK